MSDIPFLTSDTIQQLDAVPSRLLVLRAGYTGLEFAQMMHRFGSKVTVFERGGQILRREDAEVAEALANCLRREGLEIQLNAAVEEVRKSADGQAGVTFPNARGKTGMDWISPVGRLGPCPSDQGPGFAHCGSRNAAKGFIKVNDCLETNVSGIWALGDVSGGPQFTHASLDDFRILRDNVFGNAFHRS